MKKLLGTYLLFEKLLKSVWLHGLTDSAESDSAVSIKMFALANILAKSRPWLKTYEQGLEFREKKRTEILLTLAFYIDPDMTCSFWSQLYVLWK